MIRLLWVWGIVDGVWQHTYIDHNDEEVTDIADSAKEACDIDRLDPYEYARDIFEHWAVSVWLADKLREHGEKVCEFSNFQVWARTTTGQRICDDYVMRKIAESL